MQLYRDFGKAPGDLKTSFKKIDGTKDNTKYHIRIDRDSSEFQKNAFISNTLFSSFHVVIEDETYNYPPHYYYDDDGNFRWRDYQNLDQGKFKDFADARAKELVADNNYPPALTKDQVEAISKDEKDKSAKGKQNAQANEQHSLNLQEQQAQRLFEAERDRRKKFNLKALTLDDYNGVKYRGKHKLPAVKTLPPEKDQSNSSSNSNQVISNNNSSSSAYSQSSFSPFALSSPLSSSTTKITIETSKVNFVPSTLAATPLIINSNNSSAVPSSKKESQSSVKNEVKPSLSTQDQKTSEKDQKK